MVTDTALTVDTALTRVRAIQRLLDRGELTVPYPPEIRAELLEIERAFIAHCTTQELAIALLARIGAPDLPW